MQASATPLPGPYWLVTPLDLGATLLWAMSGAQIGLQRGYDVVGVFIVALVSSTGGGLLRDSIFLQEGPPVLVKDWRYLALNILACAVVAIIGTRVGRMVPLFLTTDALGVGAYAVVGMQKSIEVGLSVYGIVLVGVVNAAGGAFLRDIVVREEPAMMQPGEYYALVALAGCLVFMVMRALHAPIAVAAWTAIAVAFLMRILTVRYGWRTRPLTGMLRRRGP